MRYALTVLILTAATSAAAQKFEHLADRPPMGWNSWNTFACDVTEKDVKAAADAMVSSGMRAVGYQYVVVDDCWHGERDQAGFIQAHPKRFPSGMKALADYVHARGLRFGLYSDAGWKTCGGRPGSRGYEFQDALTYARWGVDYLKYDWCNTDKLNAEGAYLTMSRALRAAKRPVLLSICEWGNNEPWKWGAEVGHMWRTTGDITSCFDCVVGHGNWKSRGILPIIDLQTELREHAGPHHWNDPDMMEVGNGMSTGEDRAHFSLWAMMAAPLIAGNDLSTMSQTTRAILTNREVVAVDQDRLGIQGFVWLERGDLQVWAKPLARGALALAFVNRGRSPETVEVVWTDHVIKDDLNKRHFDLGKHTYRIRDLWSHKHRGTTRKPLRTTLPAHDVMMLRLDPTGNAPKPGSANADHRVEMG